MVCEEPPEPPLLGHAEVLGDSFQGFKWDESPLYPLFDALDHTNRSDDLVQLGPPI